MLNPIVERRLNIAFGLLKEVEVNVQYEFWNSCVNRLYYACFHAVRALLTAKDVNDVKTHAGVWSMFNLHIVRPGLIPHDQAAFYSTLMDCRSEADYDDFQEFSREEVESFMEGTRVFLQQIKDLVESL